MLSLRVETVTSRIKAKCYHYPPDRTFLPVVSLKPASAGWDPGSCYALTGTLVKLIPRSSFHCLCLTPYQHGTKYLPRSGWR